MRRALIVRGTVGTILVGLLGSTGCTHNYYYGTVPTACAPGTTTVIPGAVQYGSVCDIPSRLFGGGGATVVAASPGVRSSVVGGSSSSGTGSRVVVSEPANRSGLSWRRSDPESGITTRVEGNLTDEETTVK